MIASLQGLVQQIGKDFVVLQVGGFGLRVFVPRLVLSQAQNDPALFLYTYFAVRENEFSLYGFSSSEELRLFELLLTVNKVGPKLALSILSTLSPELIRSAVIQEEAVIFQRVPGIGKKSAEAIIFALRGKLDQANGSSLGLVSDLDSDVIELLTTLGFSVVEAQTAVQKVGREITDIDQRVAEALKHLDKG